MVKNNKDWKDKETHDLCFDNLNELPLSLLPSHHCQIYILIRATSQNKVIQKTDSNSKLKLSQHKTYIRRQMSEQALHTPDYYEANDYNLLSVQVR